MGLRFSIIKDYKTSLGPVQEDVVHEHHEPYVIDDIVNNMRLLFTEKKQPRFGKKKFTEEEVVEIFKKSWRNTVDRYKKVTKTIL